jgi:hypothetical protein
MSTQRREDGHTSATKACRRGPRDRWQKFNSVHAAGLGHSWLVLMAWFARIIATVGTAPPLAAEKQQALRLATNSLQPDYLDIQPVRLPFRRASRTAPPIPAGRRTTAGVPATRRSSLRLTPTPSAVESLHPFRSKTPAGKSRWSERYDGKRNMYFQHAA